jgi:murein DD-endopeptidase MepM/ murein hydrolase activator NlpD
LAVGAGVIVVLTAMSILATWSLVTNTVDRGELVRIREENDQLRLTNRSFEDSIRDLERQLNGFEERTRQLAIVAGLDGLTESEQAGIGGADYSKSLGVLGSRADVLAGSLADIADSLKKQDAWEAAMPTVAPVRGILTSGFGYRRDPVTGRRAHHYGVDISTAPGRPVQAPGQGIVIQAGRVGGLGNAITVSHGHGVTTRYGHLAKINVRAGQSVEQGDVLGTVGSTGKSTGYHLHYEVRVDGSARNPVFYLLDWPRLTRADRS